MQDTQGLTIKFAPRVMHRIADEVLEAFNAVPRRGAETGGILLGRREAGGINVEDFEPVPCVHRFGPSYVLDDAERKGLEESLDRFRSVDAGVIEVLGFYRSQTRAGIELDDRDDELMAHLFPEASSFFLLLKPGRNQNIAASVYGRAEDAWRAIGEPVPFPLEEPLPAPFLPVELGPAPALRGRMIERRHLSRIEEPEESSEVGRSSPLSRPVEQEEHSSVEGLGSLARSEALDEGLPPRPRQAEEEDQPHAWAVVRDEVPADEGVRPFAQQAEQEDRPLVRAAGLDEVPDISGLRPLAQQAELEDRPLVRAVMRDEVPADEGLRPLAQQAEQEDRPLARAVVRDEVPADEGLRPLARQAELEDRPLARAAGLDEVPDVSGLRSPPPPAELEDRPFARVVGLDEVLDVSGLRPLPGPVEREGPTHAKPVVRDEVAADEGLRSLPRPVEREDRLHAWPDRGEMPGHAMLRPLPRPARDDPTHAGPLTGPLDRGGGFLKAWNWRWGAALGALAIVAAFGGYNLMVYFAAKPQTVLTHQPVTVAQTTPPAVPAAAPVSRNGAADRERVEPAARTRGVAPVPPTGASISAPGQSVEDALVQWQRALRSGNPAAIAACYVRGQRGAASQNGKLAVLRISEIRIVSEPSGRATATFRKHWQTAGPHVSSGEAEERLVLARSGNEWKIASEEEIKVYWTHRAE